MNASGLQLPDRSFLGPSIRGSLFLVRQPFVYLPGLAAALGCFAWVTALSVENGKATFESLAIMAAISPLVGFGFAMMTALPIFLIYRLTSVPKPKLTTAAGERTLESCLANHLLDHEGRGGRLHLTTDRIVFVPHRFNVQLAGCSIPLSEIISVGWGRVIGPSGVPLSFVVEVEETGGRQTFIITAAEKVAASIDRLRRMSATERRLSAEA